MEKIDIIETVAADTIAMVETIILDGTIKCKILIVYPCPRETLSTLILRMPPRT